MEEEAFPEPVVVRNNAEDIGNMEEVEDVPAAVSTTRDVLPYENWAEAVRRREEPLPENLINVMNQVFQNEMLLEHILEKVIELKDRPAVRGCRLVSKQWTCGISKLYRKMKKPLFVVNTNKDVFTHNEPPRPIFEHHTILCEFLRPMTRPVRIEGFIPTFALHLSPQFFRKCNYNDFVNCLVQCGPSLVELQVNFPKNSQMSFLLPPGISLPNLIAFGVSFSSQTLHSNLYVGPFQHHHQHDYLPNHSSVHFVQSILNSASHLRNFHFMRSQSPMNPPDLENLYLPDSLISVKIETPLRGFEFLLRKHFSLLTELSLNATYSMYTEGEIYDMLGKLSSTLRSLSLTGSINNSYRQSLAVRLPRMENLTKFAIFKPWEFEERSPPINFEEMFPKMEALVFATQTEGSFSYLMSGMRSTSVTSFSVWLTSAGTYNRPAQAPGGPAVMYQHPGFPFVDPNRIAGGPILMGNRMDDILFPRDPARIQAQAYRARRLLQDRRAEQRRGPHVENGRDVGPGVAGVRPPPRVVGEVNQRQLEHHRQLREFFELGINNPAALADEWQQERIYRIRRARLRMAAEIQRRALEHHHHVRRREAVEAARDAAPVLPRCVHLRRRLQELQEVRRDLEDRRPQQQQPPPPPPPYFQPLPLPPQQLPQVRIEVIPNERVVEAPPRPQILLRRPRLQLAPPRPPPMADPERELLVISDDSSDSDEEIEEMLRVLRPVQAVQGAENGNNERMQPLQVLAAAAIAERQQRILNFDVRPPQVVHGIEIVHPEEDNFVEVLNPAPIHAPVVVVGPMVNRELNNANANNEVRADAAAGNQNAAENNDNNDVAEDAAAAMEEENADGADGDNNRDQPADEGRNNADGRPRFGAGNEEWREMPRRRPLPGRLPHRMQMLEDIGLVGRRRPMIRLHHQHLLPERPVTMTKEKMQSINLAFPNLTKLKINICGPEICGLKYIFEEMRSLQILKIVVEKSLWPIKWDSLLTGIPVEFCEAVKLSSELWDEVYLNENHVSIRNLTKLEVFAIVECLKVNDHLRHEPRNGEEHLISDVAFHFALLKMKNLKHLTVTPGFTPSQSMLTKWYQEKGYKVETKAIGRMDTEYEQ